MNPKSLFLLSLFFSVLSCAEISSTDKLVESLNMAGDNREELQKVLACYQAPKDSLKLKAAKFLIENMRYHSYTSYGDSYELAFEKSARARKYYDSLHIGIKASSLAKKVNKVFERAIDSLEKEEDFKVTRQRIFDIKSLDAEFLIENIELAFEAYAQNPLNLCRDFQEFLEYVLPYRVLNEPLEKEKRKELFEKYKWALDSLKYQPLDDVIDKIYKNVKLYGGFWGEKYKYPGVPSLSEIEATGFGDCTYLTFYFVNVLRSIGIPSGVDYCPRWGINIERGRHHWPFYFTEKGFRSVDTGSNEIRELNKIYRISGLPKIFRKSFDLKNEKDLTVKYHSAHDLKIENLWGGEILNPKDVYLGVFTPKRGWDKVVSASSVKENIVCFDKIADNMIYGVFVRKGRKKKLINNPFQLKSSGHIRFFKKDPAKIEKAIISRKYPPFKLRSSKYKIKRIKTLNDCVLQGSNKKTGGYRDLYKIENFYTTQNVSIHLKEKVYYKYYRFKGKEERAVQLANFKLLDEQERALENYTNIELYGGSGSDLKRILDGNQLTYLKKKNLDIIYSFDKPQWVSGFQIQARNDGNHIDVGDTYELLYWDRGWLSLGEKIASDTLLIYQDIPKNTLYWLKNKTKGKEEFVFTFDKFGKQFWTGVSEYEFVDLDSLYKSFE